MKALLPPGPDAALCFTRTYDAEHLSRHPKQKVTALVLFLRYVTLGEDEATLIAKETAVPRSSISAMTSPWRRRLRIAV